MNYKEKYEQALERAKELFEYMNKKEYFASSRDIENIFPELQEQESEDERMLQEIKRYIKEQGDKPTGLPTGTVAVSDMLAWLEKQKAADEEIIFRPIVGTDIRIAAKQALEKIDIGKKVVLAFNGAYIPVNGKTVGEIDSEYDAWLEKQEEPKDKDECIRKAICGWIYTRPSQFFDDGFSKEEMLAWVENKNKTLNVELLTKVLIKHLYTCINKTNTYVRSEEDHITLPELIVKIKADLNIK